MPVTLVKVPVNLDIEEVMKELSTDDLPNKSRSRDILLAICGTLTQLQLRHGGYLMNEDGLINLCAKYLRHIHAEYHQYMKYLCDAGVLETDRQYIPQEKCLGYRYSSTYNGQELREVEINDQILKRALRKQHEDIRKAKKENLKRYSHIISWYMKNHLTIDIDAAMKFIHDENERRVAEISSSEIEPEEQEKQLMILGNIRNSMEYFVRQIHEKTYDETEFSVDAFGERLHGMFSYRDKELRNFIKHRDETLVAVDVKNCQPFLLLALMNSHFWESKKAKKRSKRLQLYEIAPDIYREMRKDGTLQECIMMLKSSRTLVQWDFLTRTFENLVISGRIYEHIIQSMPKYLSKKFMAIHGQRISDRPNAKVEMLRIMYCSNKQSERPFYETCNAFSRMFPRVSSIINIVRSGRDNRLANILQRLESHLILKRISKKLAKDHPDIPMYTIHDSIVTTDQHKETVKANMEGMFAELLGIVPAISFEVWSPKKTTLGSAAMDRLSLVSEIEDVEVDTGAYERLNFDGEKSAS